MSEDYLKIHPVYAPERVKNDLFNAITIPAIKIPVTGEPEPEVRVPVHILEGGLDTLV
jgi:hypothetical protein